MFKNGLTIARYEYDSLGRLKREDNRAINNTTVFSYDDNGNILAKHEYAFTMKNTNELKELTPEDTILYTYDNDSDRLLSYDNEQFVYDSIGNPTTYRGKTAAWKFGRELVAYDGNTFAYDARGRRISKNDISFVYDHTGKLIKQYRTNTETNEISDILEFIYDHTGIFAFKYGDSTFFYRKNVQGDITAILDNTGKIVVKYTYNAWGECKVFDSNGVEIDKETVCIANLNPFRYRSYYLDTETNLYFLKTRYYDPEVGRFITIDDTSYLAPDTINGLNLYAYCLNDPVNKVDSNGNFPWHVIIGTVAGATVGFATSVITDLTTEGKIDWRDAGISAASGALSGLTASLGVPAAGQFAINAVLSGTEDALKQGLDLGFENIDWAQTAVSSVIGGITSIGNGIKKGVSNHLNKAGDALTKSIRKNGFSKSVKYYLSQTKKLFYNPLIKDTVETFAKSTAFNTITYHLNNAYEFIKKKVEEWQRSSSH